MPAATRCPNRHGGSHVRAGTRDLHLTSETHPMRLPTPLVRHNRVHPRSTLPVPLGSTLLASLKKEPYEGAGIGWADISPWPHTCLGLASKPSRAISQHIDFLQVSLA
mgnify:CR=1 FL=1